MAGTRLSIPGTMALPRNTRRPSLEVSVARAARYVGSSSAPARDGGPMDDARSGAHAMPRLPRTFVARPGLWQRLDEATGPGVTMLVAPVGSGKTLGVAGWVHSRSAGRARGALWVHGDASLDPQRLAALLDAANGDVDVGGTGDGVRLLVVDDAH